LRKYLTRFSLNEWLETVWPSILDRRVLSPCNGKIAQVHRKRHAVTLATDEGFEILIPTGIGTVSLDGEGFQIQVSDGQRVNKGDLWVEFDADLIAQKAKSSITAKAKTAYFNALRAENAGNEGYCNGPATATV
jgi:phosphotransferase system IIA component